VAAVLNGAWAPLGWSIGFIEAPVDRVLAAVVAIRSTEGQRVVLDDPGPWPDCIPALAPLEAPWTAELVAGHGVNWTVYLNNWIHGGDPWPFVSQVAHRLRTRWLVAAFQPPTAPGHAQAKLEIGGPDGQPPLNQLRSIEARAEDGHWSWHATGRALPFEQAQTYRARRIRDRLPRPLLIDYLHALDIDVDDNARYTRPAVIRQVVDWRIRRLTLAQARSDWGLNRP
jgi:hypothetical protein